jgi:adenine-specific DNA-methyltransferase
VKGQPPGQTSLWPRPASEARSRKSLGAYYTPEPVVETLVRWVVRSPSDRMLDPACGDGRFLATHTNSLGVDQDQVALETAARTGLAQRIVASEFFTWASRACERFDCAAGNPPFIRYQRFNGATRRRALALCARHGARLSALTSSWAPFLVATAPLLKPGGRMAFVVPAEIGHAPYAAPVLRYLLAHFTTVRLLAVREKLFPDLSEDCWLLYAGGYGGSSEHVVFATTDRFRPSRRAPRAGAEVSLADWEEWGCRLRPFLLSREARSLYAMLRTGPRAARLRALARVGIGYVTGDNDFFHLCPSTARETGIPARVLQPSVRSGSWLAGEEVTEAVVQKWAQEDRPLYLLHLGRTGSLPQSVRRYLDSPVGMRARARYKCRVRHPWYVVPHVTVPDLFLNYMSNGTPRLVANPARCAATNAVHIVELRTATSLRDVIAQWRTPLTALSCELEGHPLGGGMLKMEPREAGRVLLAQDDLDEEETRTIQDGIATLRNWRHYAQRADEV